MPGPPKLLVAVLAAGASRRLGCAKQLVAIDGEPLLRRQCRCALDAAVGPTVAILGCEADRHRRVVADLPVNVHVNREWAEGMASTLRCAVDAAESDGAALLVVQCDQYRVTPMDLRTLREQWRADPSLAYVSRAGGYAGPPAILPIQYYDLVRGLRGDIGARAILYRPPWSAPIEVVNPRASFDLDSPEDVAIAAAWTGGGQIEGARAVAAGALNRSRSTAFRTP